MENKQYMNTTMSNFEKVNEEFVKCTIAVNSYDQVANGTKFTKESIDKALPTLNYAPVIGYMKNGEFSDHGIEYKISSDGFEEVINTIPFGVCIKDSARYEKLQKDNGEYEEYVVVDCYLWGRYKQAIDEVKSNKLNQSMEVSINSAEYKDGYYEISDFSYSACCILGEDVTPAFNLAKIRTSDKFSKDEFKACYTEMTSALDKFLNLEEGGCSMDEKKEFEEEIKDDNDSKDFTEETTQDEQFEEEKEDTVDDEDEKDDEDEDEDFKKKKCEEESDEEKVDYQAIISDLRNELKEIKDSFEALETEAKELREFKNTKDAELKATQIEGVFAQYDDDLSDISEYAELKSNATNYSIEELEDKCLILFGKMMKAKKIKKTPSKKEFTKLAIDSNVQDVSNNEWAFLDKYIK